MKLALLIIFIIQLAFAVNTFYRVPKTLAEFFFMYANFCTMFFTFLAAVIVIKN